MDELEKWITGSRFAPLRVLKLGTRNPEHLWNNILSGNKKVAFGQAPKWSRNEIKLQLCKAVIRTSFDDGKFFMSSFFHDFPVV